MRSEAHEVFGPKTDCRPLLLVIDDERLQRDYFQRILTSHGYQVVLASNGADGMRATCNVHPALIILDINMPGMDGAECYRLFRAVAATRSIPILLATALTLPPGILRLVRSGLGGVHVFLKKDGRENLLSKVSSIIKNQLPHQPEDTEASLDARIFYRMGREISVNAKVRRITIDGRELPQLAARRFDLLSELLETEGVLSRDELLARIWKGIDNPNLVDVTVFRLRQDLKKVSTLRIRIEHDGYSVAFCGPPPRA